MVEWSTLTLYGVTVSPYSLPYVCTTAAAAQESWMFTELFVCCTVVVCRDHIKRTMSEIPSRRYFFAWYTISSDISVLRSWCTVRRSCFFTLSQSKYMYVCVYIEYKTEAYYKFILLQASSALLYLAALARLGFPTFHFFFIYGGFLCHVAYRDT